MTAKLSQWPGRLPVGGVVGPLFKVSYERARANAAIPRLRICEAVLQDIRVNAHTLEDAIGYATEALTAIGDLPNE